MAGVALQPSGAMTLRVSASMMSLVFIALIIRVWARQKTHHRLLSEEYFVLLAAAFFYSNQGIYLYAIMGNGGTGSADLNEYGLAQFDRYSQYILADEITFVLSITFVKLSILLFYRHIFTLRNFRQVNWVLLGTVTCWGITALFVVIFQCSPVHGLWSMEMKLAGQTTCLNSPKMIFGFEITNVLIDVTILIPPVFMVQRLQLHPAKRASLSIIFLLGLFVCITCGVRAHYIWDPTTGMARSVPASMDWTAVEQASAIVCACLPTYGPLFSNTSHLIPGLKAWYLSLRSTLQRTLRGSSESKTKNLTSHSGHSVKSYSDCSQVEMGPVQETAQESV
ncbi:hypothetical protein BDV40DRAFT_301853 [Aspergillus tamarii]|uniref:Rhodopsin domain-containing protein n=1 Tax=Aspergillus tamarii TaxID=41984 RepID=A0A5N6UQX3_ASPTM|nr:hypothetical protein BDV40DRAFT_301853 [Aspergillus tamarii]